ncbi:hypothetical protein E5Q_05213 [Mixia osmundae IAM 14324]|uniref:Uncharacterized protein n=1 Tax=Mixia osmundae (strain CBS 9802 / IAM 14324 / JCM 22182 / KY 12970) TaxID=764103 RepID=G7E6R6_MIXOS|nr:hypothetical protein E5Q_05213 [Mixia osmundae IAM 14324]
MIAIWHRVDGRAFGTEFGSLSAFPACLDLPAWVSSDELDGSIHE